MLKATALALSDWARISNAFSNYCPHMGAKLTGSHHRGQGLICWWHGSTFNLESGEVTLGPGSNPLRMYEIKVEEGNVILVKPGDELYQWA